MKKRSAAPLKTYLLSLLFLGCGMLVHSQENDLSHFAYPITRSDDTYTGAGIDWIRQQARGKQFVAFGEQHGVGELPAVVTAVYRLLHPEGFQHLLLEIDDVTSRKITEMGVEEVMQTYPHAMAFDYDGELEMIAEVERMNQGDRRIWGLDQMVTAIHPFRMLEDLADRSKTKRICRGLFFKATLKAGAYLRQEHFADLDLLQRLFEEESHQEALNIVRELRTSMEIYVAYRQGQRGEISRSESVILREDFMKQQFDRFINAAGGPAALPKAVLKMGGAHTAYGIGPNGIPTLGGHIAEVSNDGLLNLGIMNYTGEEDFLPTDIFGDGAAVLLDSRQIRAGFDSLSLAALPENLQRNLRYFDGIIYLNRSPQASKSTISRYEKDFRDHILSILGFVALLVLLNLSLIYSLLKLAFAQQFRADRIKHPLTYHAKLLTLSMLLDAIIIVQIMAIAGGMIFPRAAPIAPGLGFGLFAVLFLLALTPLIRIRSDWKNGWWTPAFRRHFALVALTNLILTGFMYYWNLGGMLGE